jgi:hypothetical protein
MHTLIAIIGLLVLIVLGALQIRSEEDSARRDFAAVPLIIALIMTLYYAF